MPQFCVVFRLAIFSLLSCFVSSTSAHAQQACQEVKVSGHANLPPLSWYANDTLHGAGMMALRKILAKENIRIIPVEPGSPQRLTKALKEGRVDITLTATNEVVDLRTVNLIAPTLYTTNYLVLVRKDSDHVPQSWDDLKSLRGVVPRELDLGNSFEKFAEKNLPISRVHRAQQGLLMLKAKRVDYAIYPLIQADLLVSLYNYEGTLRKAPVEISSQDFYLGVSKHIDCRLPLDRITAELQNMHKGAEIDRLANDALYQWMGLHL
ncbi:transporter substrate-binding domain-containing protein [Aestuariirhabdus sp. Z084]|uniref:substrate-binding periplasmic protein n=1 Tax=Aestuariirhabdus haliotis TaxID=2918751 RepID=UPI00201B45DB|nr:transporter substrate-binding domain-containing protein [Aestuariirhabdus haliotis]MCL6416065.1 transporter substrate-binding domain-containing protein [Aestuariirhabdus haliotis]MCL6419367.1 transporter substrate-binding domain-containing protein [Aestuariirhabdus haliotis]